MTYEEGLHLLQMRKEALDSGEAKRLPAEVLGNSFFLRDAGNEMLQEKQAAPAWLQNLGKTWNKQPLAMKSTLIGGGLGALGGLGKTVMDDEDDSYFNNMMTGGLAGTAIGGGLGLAMDSKTRKSIADRAATMGDKALNAPDRDESPEAYAARKMKVDPATGLSTEPINRQEDIALEEAENAQGFIPKIDSRLNTSTNVAVRAGEMAPAAAGAAVMAKNPAKQVDPAAALKKAPGVMQPEAFAAELTDDAEYKKLLAESEEAAKKYLLDKEELERLEKLKKRSINPNYVYEELPLAQRELREAYADAAKNYGGYSSTDPKARQAFMEAATPEQLAAFQRVRGMGQEELDELFKRLKIAPGQVSGTAAIDDISSYFRPGQADKVLKPVRRFDPAAAIAEVAAAPAGSKAYQLDRIIRRLPKRRMAALAALGFAGTQGSKLLGFRDKADKSVEEQARRMANRNAIERILEKSYNQQGNQ